MKKKIVVRINWSSKKPLQMASVGHAVAEAMDGNANFKTPVVKPSEMGDAANLVETTYPGRKNGSIAKDSFNSAVIDLDEKLHYQADYVSNLANGDETIIHSSGFESTGNKILSKNAAPFIVKAPVLVAVKGGGIKVKIEKVPNARYYCYILFVDAAFSGSIINGQLNFAAGSNPIIINSTKTTVTFTGLPTLKPVSVAVVAFNAGGNSGFSPVATDATSL